MGKSLLIGALSPETYRKIRISVAPRKPIELSLNELISVLDTIYEPEKNNLIARMKLLDLKQEQDEPIQRFSERVKEGIAQCYFDNTIDVKDLFATIVFSRGLRNSDMKKAILQQHRIKPNSSFLESMNTAMGIEIIRGTEPDQVNFVKHKRNHVQKGKRFEKKVMKCYCCNKTGHLKKDCKYKDKTCLKCKKVGHLKYVCKSRNKVVGAISGDSDNDSEIDTTVSESEVDIYEIRENLQRGNIRMELNNVEVESLLDTGACKTLLSEKSWRSVGAPTLIDFNENKIETLGVMKTNMNYKGKVSEVEVTVAKGVRQNLLGRDLLGILRIDMNKFFYGKPEGILAINIDDEMKKSLEIRYPNLFSSGLGSYTGEMVKINVKEEAQPKIIIYRCSNLNLKDQVRLEIERLEKLDVWEPVKALQWISPMSVALKADGRVRICANFSQTINKVLDCEQYQIPAPHELFNKIQGCNLFSNFDITDAFLSVMVEPQSRKYLVVSTSIGLMQYKRLPFGLASAPMIFQRIMSELLNEHNEVAVYFDDVVIGGKDIAEHDKRMHAVLEKLEISGFKLNINKSAIRKPEVRYLGNILDKRGIRPDENKTKAIKEMRNPTSLMELKSFLGIVIHYSKFIPNLSIIAKPLNELTKKNRKFELNEQCIRSIKILKEILVSDKILVPYSRDLPIIFAADASQYGYGAVVMHRFKDGSERPIEFTSKTFNDAQVNYSQVEKECCDIVNGILKFKDYLLGREFVLQTDSIRIDRWSCQLKRFHFRTEYINTKAFGKADGLSRLPLNENQQLENNDTQESAVLVIENSPLDLEMIVKETGKDKKLQQVIKFINGKWPRKLNKQMKEFDKIKYQLSVVNGLVMKNEQIYIPEVLRPETLRKLHEGHIGTVRMKLLARSNFYWVNMNQQIEDITKKCNTCMSIGIPVKNTNLHSWTPASESFERVHIDMCGPMGGESYLVVYDIYTCYPFVERLKHGTSDEIIKILDKIFVTFQTPKVIVSDNGRNFVSEKIRSYYKKNNIKFLNSPPYHPQSNGPAENLVKKFKTSYYKSKKDGLTSNEAVREFLRTTRNCPSTRTMKTPIEMMLNKKVKILRNNCLKEDSSKIHSEKRENIFAKERSVGTAVKKDMDPTPFKANDEVWHRTKFQNEWNKGVVKRDLVLICTK
uniref:RNA-directed DNA polymerase n=1 Tax=Parastrongyloides trichosuri TaxID=131310 RepID=A0A0N4ZZR0_PARTI